MSDEDRDITPSASNTVRQAYQGLEGLNAAADAVEAVMAMPGWAIIMELAQTQEGAINRKLRGGSKPLEQAEYAMWHGRLNGLTTLRDLAIALVDRRRKVMAEQQAKHETEATDASVAARS